MQTLYSAAQALEFDRPVRLLALVSLELDAKRRDIIAQQIAQVLDIPQVRCDVVEMPNTMALRAAVSLGHRLGDYDAYVVFDNHTDGAGIRPCHCLRRRACAFSCVMGPWHRNSSQNILTHR